MFYGVMRDGDLFGVVKWFANRPTPADFGLTDGEIIEVTILVG
jgi:hypothetical protein